MVGCGLIAGADIGHGLLGQPGDAGDFTLNDAFGGEGEDAELLGHGGVLAFGLSWRGHEVRATGLFGFHGGGLSHGGEFISRRSDVVLDRTFYVGVD